ncbi:hypothetical protein E1J38_011710 [Seonamhaeicola sediminis]|uniref:Peptidase S74 domain-containing protein n=1 Tax=Seonamhaeicola sediminis TaxID=2528206 RepID=A0A562YCB0_9FLAO|nr:tail fiber domain-containing protein [Seonamhaeicola sediminis]TWO32035.1 hypothetical protein E1J38_011710 [Seonamhaeicola sediminis]
MKKVILILTLALSTLTFAQKGINYKALIKDDSNNVLSNQNITIEFSILEGPAADFSSVVYAETHSATTDANGIVIVNIGEGNPLSGFDGEYENIDWGNFFASHFLKVQIDTGSGLTDMGTTEFKAVPYALYAQNSNTSGLEILDEGNGEGWRLKNRPPNNYGLISFGAVDLSISTSESTTRGATGNYATALGRNTTASGQSSFASGINTSATQSQATAMGASTVASGFNSVAMGQYTRAEAPNSTAIGLFNVGGGDPLLASATDPLFEIGNGYFVDGTNDVRTNALTVLRNGTITAPTFDMAEITDPKALITKEYADANYSGGGSGTSPTGLETLDEGNGIGWRLIGRNPANFGAVGENAVDMSYNPDASEDFGALGTANFTAGYKTKATNLASTALGNETIASGFSTTALGFGTIADDQFSTVVGRLNDNTTATNILFQIGNGNTGGRSNAFNVNMDGIITAPSFDISEITDPKALITKEYADANLSSTGLEALDEGNGTGWRLTGANPTYYGNIGSNAVDLSYSNLSSSVLGATGENAFATGSLTQALGFASTSMGYFTEALGAYSTAVGKDTNAVGTSSFAVGEVTYATGTASTAMGVSSQASGFASTAMGYIVNADDEASTVVGSLNDATFSTSTLFQVGNGNNINDRSNALTVLENGYSAFGTHNVEPNSDLHLFHDNDGTLNGFKLQNKGTNENWWRFYTLNSNGQLYLYSKAGGNASPVGSFDDASGAYTALSDRRAKANFNDLYFNWQEFMQLQPLTYHYKSDENKKSHIGFVAQDVEPIYPELVNHNKEDDLYQLNYSGFGVVAIKAIQELKKENEQLKALLLKEQQDSAEQSEILQTLLKRVEAIEKQQSSSVTIQLVKN